MSRSIILVYGLVSYVFFLGVFLYAIGFVGDVFVPRTINNGVVGPTSFAIAINVALLGVFGVQHSIMARPWFKARWTKVIPPAAERSTFVLVTNVLFVLLFLLWRPLPAIVWHIDAPAARAVVWGVFAAGWAMVLYSTLLIDHFDLFGLRQVWLHFRGAPYAHRPFMERSLYRVIRHPLMAGFIVAFWAAPTMTAGRLLFALVTTAYVVVAIHIEERDLGRFLGDDYARYRRRTPMLVPFTKRGGDRATRPGTR